MSTNQYFNNYTNAAEQTLVNDLMVEAIKMYGMDMYYCPRTIVEKDEIYGESPIHKYTANYPIEMYIKNIDGFEGDGQLLSKFGLEIRDEATLLVSRLRFRYAVNGLTRPLEGDLIYIPMTTSFFEITSVESENDQAMFYTLGRGRGANVYVYALKLKQLVFSNELISTGIPEIDDQIRDAYPRTRITLTSGNGTFVNDEIVYQGNSLANATAQATVYTFAKNTHIDIIRTQGTFVSGNVRGNVSSANWIISTISDAVTMNTAFEDIVDNARIEAEADGIMDWTETNPFGTD